MKSGEVHYDMNELLDNNHIVGMLEVCLII